MRQKTLLVRAPGDIPCPMHVTRHVVDRTATEAARALDPDAVVQFRTYIYSEPVRVPNARFYRRRIAMGDLVVVTESPPRAERDEVATSAEGDTTNTRRATSRGRK